MYELCIQIISGNKIFEQLLGKIVEKIKELLKDESCRKNNQKTKTCL